MCRPPVWRTSPRRRGAGGEVGSRSSPQRALEGRTGRAGILRRAGVLLAGDDEHTAVIQRRDRYRGGREQPLPHAAPPPPARPPPLPHPPPLLPLGHPPPPGQRP